MSVEEFNLLVCRELSISLRERGWRTVIAREGDEILDLISKEVPQSLSIGVPGSLTIRQLGLIEKLERNGYHVIEHWRDPEKADVLRRKEVYADVFLTSVNAASLTGELVILDYCGNRSGGSLIARKVYYLVSANKIEKDLDSALRRAWWKATGINALRFKISPEKLTRVTVILHGPPKLVDGTVILIPKEFGF